jgi:hypothetical protein
VAHLRTHARTLAPIADNDQNNDDQNSDQNSGSYCAACGQPTGWPHLAQCPAVSSDSD